MTDPIADFEGLLLAGHSINVVGISGSGRTKTVAALAQHLVESGVWEVVHWTRTDLVSLSRQEKADAIESIRGAERIPALMIDDFGDYLVTADGKWLEQFLFAAVSVEADDLSYLRCVITTSPRDREIQVAGSGLRERCKVVFPVRSIALELEGQFGGINDESMRNFCGGTHHLAAPSGVSAESARGIAMRKARDRGTTWVGELRGDHHARLADIFSRSRTSPSRWRTGGTDDCLVPVVVCSNSRDGGGNCFVIEALNVADYLPLLLTSRWPDRDLEGSARRFVARCGNEPHPRWVDTFLSDSSILRLRLLVEFVQRVCSQWSDGRVLQLLSRNFVGGRVITAASLVGELRAAGLRPEDERRLEWRLFDQRATGNLHKRQLLLPSRTAAFDLPPVTVIVGQYAVGNESDAEVLIRDHREVQQAWMAGQPLW